MWNAQWQAKHYCFHATALTSFAFVFVLASLQWHSASPLAAVTGFLGDCDGMATDGDEGGNGTGNIGGGLTGIGQTESRCGCLWTLQHPWHHWPSISAFFDDGGAAGAGGGRT